jgi:fucose permease
MSIWRDPIFWFVMVLVVIYSGVYNCLPVTFPVFKRAFGTSLEQMGRTQSLFFISGILFSFCGGWIIGRMGLKRSLMTALLGIAAALSIIGGARGFPAVLLGAFCFGLAMTALSVIYSCIISGHFGQKRQSVFFLTGLADGSGAVAGTAALGAWFAHAESAGGNWRAAYYAAAAIVAAQALWAWGLRSNGALPERPDSTPSASGLSAMKQVLRNPDLYAAGILAFFHGLAQGGMISFVGQLYQKRFAIDAAMAAYFISVNSGGQFGGRFVLSWITARSRIHELVVLVACAFLAALAFVATILSPGYLSGLVIFMLAGVFVSGNGPSLNSYVGMRFPSQLMMAYALFGGFNGIGAAVGPYLIGAVGNSFGLETSIWFGPVASLSLALFALLWFLRERSCVPAKATAL